MFTSAVKVLPQEGKVCFVILNWKHPSELAGEVTVSSAPVLSLFPDRNGVFVSSELEDFELLLQRLSYIGGVLQTPHPIPKYSAAGGLDFHARFVLHCLEHNLQYLLYTYLDYYRYEGFSPLKSCACLNNETILIVGSKSFLNPFLFVKKGCLGYSRVMQWKTVWEFMLYSEASLRLSCQYEFVHQSSKETITVVISIMF